MEFDPIQARKSGTDLDALATRLENDLRAKQPALAVEHAGTDEVSVRAAETLRGVASSYDDAATQGIHEIRKLAAALRSHTDELLRMDDDNAVGFGPAR
ncbi:PE domain-containing protein [Nocardia sp. NBC_01730]|uniref:PE domain-containing protein n=1 Tax=Nocardia sp. NBC_01730 TaxID=2975998 RepID=UPI002E15D032|nr:PE domain-containing protein [Nocardia sp. NBC_01730]